FGTSGPYANYKCFDMVAQSAAGSYSVTGESDGPPMRPGACVADSGTGMQMALAITAAYVQKQRTGKGQLIEISMQEAMIYYMRTAVSMTASWGEMPASRGGNGTSAGMNTYPCSPLGPNDYITIVAVTDRMWKDLCNAIGREDLLTDERFSSRENQYRNADMLISAVTDWSKQHTKDQAMKILAEAGVPVSAVLDTHELFTDPHLLHRGFIHKVEHKEHGEIPLLGWAPRMSESQVPIQAAPLLSEHTDEILRDELGLGEDDIDALHQDDII
ncbi:MAG: CoA transferase, partial [Desulfobacterales bacterium]